MDSDHLWSFSSPFAKYADNGVVSPGVQLVHSSTNMTQELSAVRLPSGSVAECRDWLVIDFSFFKGSSWWGAGRVRHHLRRRHHCFWSAAEENVTSWGMPWVKTNVCGGTCFSVVTEAGSRVLPPPSRPLWVISLWQHSLSVLQFSFGLFYHSLFSPSFFFFVFVVFHSLWPLRFSHDDSPRAQPFPERGERPRPMGPWVSTA